MELPSQETEQFWILAFGPKDKSYVRGFIGKWMLFIPADRIDDTWTSIKEETELGHLGIQAKVGTAKQNPNATSSGAKLICVYTGDCRDIEDVKIGRAHV